MVIYAVKHRLDDREQKWAAEVKEALVRKQSVKGIFSVEMMRDNPEICALKFIAEIKKLIAQKNQWKLEHLVTLYLQSFTELVKDAFNRIIEWDQSLLYTKRTSAQKLINNLLKMLVMKHLNLLNCDIKDQDARLNLHRIFVEMINIIYLNFDLPIVIRYGKECYEKTDWQGSNSALDCAGHFLLDCYNYWLGVDNPFSLT